MKIGSISFFKDIFKRFLLCRRNHTFYSQKVFFLYLVLIVIFSHLLALSANMIELYGKIWSSEGFSNYRFLFKSREVIPFFGEALSISLGAWFILQVTDWAWYKCFGDISIKVHIGIKIIHFNVQLKKRLKEMWRPIFICFYGTVAIWTFIKCVPHAPVNKLGNNQIYLPWYEDNVLVAHAGGGNAEGYAYVNSLEAFERNYQLGHRVFEGDLCVTSDGMVVLEHDWEHYCAKLGIVYDGEAPAYEQFMNSKFYGTDTPMDIAMLMELMTEHEDMYFMTDYKNATKDAAVFGFQKIVQTAKEMNCEHVLERFIIQNYHDDFKHWVDSIYPFKNWIYTLYMLPEEQINPEKIIRYCEDENIPVITMWVDWISEDWLNLTAPRNMKIFVHTENDAGTANQLIQQGASGIYTDFLRNDQIEVSRK